MKKLKIDDSENPKITKKFEISKIDPKIPAEKVRQNVAEIADDGNSEIIISNEMTQAEFENTKKNLQIF